MPIKNSLNLPNVPEAISGTPAEVTSVAGDGGTTMPEVSATLPAIEGLVLPDRGDDAEFEVLHAYVTGVGEAHRQGSKLVRADFPVGTDFHRLIRLGAVKTLKDGVDLSLLTADHGHRAEHAPPTKGKG